MQKEKSLINRLFNKNIEPKQNAARNKILDLVGKNRMIILFEYPQTTGQ